jgi:limonene-1,2-epoxide hydrolase
MSPDQIVTAFITAVERRDVEAALHFVADDISYENVPMQPIVGREAVRAALGAFLGNCLSVEWVINRQMAVGNVVANERVDRFQLAKGWIELPVAGFFEVADGRITLWRDYFDLPSYTNRLAELTASV